MSNKSVLEEIEMIYIYIYIYINLINKKSVGLTGKAKKLKKNKIIKYGFIIASGYS